MKKTIRALRLCQSLLMALPFATAASAALAQQTPGGPGVPIPAEAKKAILEASGAGDLTLNGKPARLSAAAQIRGTNNLIVLSQSLRGKYAVRVLLDNGGLIHRVWIIDGNQ